MLVLTRREDQKVLFPNLGIAVEVVAILGNTVRLGIEAPREIRIVRSELELFPDPPATTTPNPSPDGSSVKSEVRNRLNAANLAIHLAQNQMQQGLAERAEEALEHALACLRSLDEALSPETRQQLAASAVHETRDNYAVGTAAMVALIVGENRPERHKVNTALSQLGYEVVEVDDGMTAVRWLADHEQPSVILMIAPASHDEAAAVDLPQVEVEGIRGLRRDAATALVGDCTVNGWFTDHVDVALLLQIAS